MAKELKTLEVLFHDTLKDVYFAEHKIVATLPKMNEAATSKQLKDAFTKHLAETKVHVQRLDEVFKIIGKKPEQKTCDAMMGIVKEGAEIMEEYQGMEPSTPVFSPPPRRSSTTRCRATARSEPGRSNLA